MANSVIGALRVMLGMDTAEFEAGSDKAQREARRLERKFDRLGGNLQKIGVGMTAALTAPLAAFGASSFKAASDAAELQSAFDQTFGDLSASMNQWAEETGNAMGRSTQAMQEMANTFGIFFNQAAPTRKEAAEMSQTFAVLAQDLASFYNVSESDALQKLRSGLAGEAEPLRDFGVFLSAAAVEAKAFEMGLADASGEISEQSKILARYQLILEGTTNAQGDVMRTSDGTANQMRRAAAAFEELQVKIGNVLLPVITPLIEKFGQLVDGLANLPEGAQQAIVIFGGIAAAAGPLLIVLGSMIKAIPVITGALGALGAVSAPVVAVVAALAGAGVLIYKNWDSIAPVLDKVAESFRQTIGEPLRAMIDEASAKLTELWNGPLGEMVRGAWELWKSFMATMWETLGTGLLRILDAAVTALGGMFNFMLDGLTVISRLLQTDFSGAWRAANEMVSGAVRSMLGVVEALVPGALGYLRDLYEGVRHWVRDKIGEVFDWARGKIREFEGAFAWLFDRVVGNSWIPDMVQRIGEEMGLLQGLMVDPAVQAANDTSDAFEDAGQRVENSVAQMVDNSLGHFDRLLRGIKGGGITDILGGLLGLGQNFGLFGKSAGGGLPTGGLLGGGSGQTMPFKIPGFATGGSMKLGGMPGLDTNILSLNGSPLARVSRGETMSITPANDRSGPLNITITMDESTGALGAFVRNESGALIAQAAPVIAGQGASQALAKLRQTNERRLA